MNKMCMKNFSTDHIYILLHLLYFILSHFIILGSRRDVKTTVVNYSTIKSSTFLDSCYQIKNELSEYDSMGLYSERLVLKIKSRNVLGILKLFYGVLQYF